MKKELHFECRHISSPSEFHREFSKLLEFPSYYGGTLDDLWDFLMNVDSPTKIFIQHFDHLIKVFSPEQEALKDIFERISAQNPFIDIKLN